MEMKFIKYNAEQFNLPNLYREGIDSTLKNNDVEQGTLIVGYTGNRKYLYMGYLRGIVRNDEGDLLYEIANAIEGEPAITLIRDPYRVNELRLPFMAAVISATGEGVLGKVIGCNGKQAVIYKGSMRIVDVDSICQITPYFKETK